MNLSDKKSETRQRLVFLNDATETKMCSKGCWGCSPINVLPLLIMVHNYSIMEKNKEENCVCHFHNHCLPGAKDDLWQSWGIQSEKSSLFLNLFFFLDNKPTPPLSPFAPNNLLFSLSIMSAIAKPFSEK